MTKIIQTEDGSEFCINPDDLISESKYFGALFQYDNQPRVSIRGVSGDTMKQILSYLEKGNMVLNGNSVLNILEAADYLMLDKVIQEAISAMPREITPSNCIDFFHAALNLDHLDISRLCYCYIQTHFELVVKYSDIGKMSIENLKAFLTDEHLNVVNEETVWRAIVKWIERNEQERIPLLPSLLVCVRVDTCEEEYIRNILNHRYVFNSEVLCSKVQKYDGENHRNAGKRCAQAVKSSDAVQLMRFGPRHHVTCALTCTYFKYEDEWSLQLSMSSGETKIITTCPVRRKGRPDFVFSTCDQRNIFVFYDSEDKFLCFDLLKCSWRPLKSPRDSGRVLLYIGTIKNRIYVILIEYPDWTLIAAVFDPICNAWNEIRSASLYDGALSVATIHLDSIYVAFPNRVDINRTKFGVIFDPETNTWTEFPLPETMSRIIKMISFEGILLMIHSQMKSVDRFFPEEGVWRPFKALPRTYSYPQPMIRNQIPFIYERYERAYADRHPIYFDLKTGEWRDGSTLLYRPDYYVMEDAAVVRKYHRQLMEDKWASLSRNWSRTD